MTPDLFLREVVDPGLKRLAALAGTPSDDRARVLIMAIAGQESAWTHRLQVGGPARSYWQFERYGGVAEVLHKCAPQIGAVCAALDIPLQGGVLQGATVYEAMAWNDTLAVAMARLLLWQDPQRLPDLGQQDAAWKYYERNWRPGAPHPDAWPARYGTALALVKGNPS